MTSDNEMREASVSLWVHKTFLLSGPEFKVRVNQVLLNMCVAGFFMCVGNILEYTGHFSFKMQLL